MAGIKSRNPFVKPLIIIGSMLISLVIVISLIIFLIWQKDNTTATFQDELQSISSEFESVEQEYAEIINSIILERSTVPDIKLSLLNSKYQEMYTKIQDYNTDLELEDLITQRITNLQILERLNNILKSEQATADYLDSYNTCKKDIKYKASDAQSTLKSLDKCTTIIEGARTEISQVPSYLFSSSCTETESPEYIISRIADSHYLLVDYYQLLVNKKGKEAELKDYEYQESAEKLKTLPKWNSCVTRYIEAQSTLVFTEKGLKE